MFKFFKQDIRPEIKIIAENLQNFEEFELGKTRDLSEGGKRPCPIGCNPGVNNIYRGTELYVRQYILSGNVMLEFGGMFFRWNEPSLLDEIQGMTLLIDDKKVELTMDEKWILKRKLEKKINDDLKMRDKAKKSALIPFIKLAK